MIDPVSVVVVRWRQGWVAHVRFADPQHDIDISNSNKNFLYNAIERHWRTVNETSKTRNTKYEGATLADLKLVCHGCNSKEENSNLV